MRPLKTRRGLAEKGDFKEAQRNLWLCSRNICARVSDSMKKFVDYVPGVRNPSWLRVFV